MQDTSEVIDKGVTHLPGAGKVGSSHSHTWRKRNIPNPIRVSFENGLIRVWRPRLGVLPIDVAEESVTRQFDRQGTRIQLTSTPTFLQIHRILP